MSTGFSTKRIPVSQCGEETQGKLLTELVRPDHPSKGYRVTVSLYRAEQQQNRGLTSSAYADRPKHQLALLSLPPYFTRISSASIFVECAYTQTHTHTYPNTNAQRPRLKCVQFANVKSLLLCFYCEEPQKFRKLSQEKTYIDTIFLFSVITQDTDNYESLNIQESTSCSLDHKGNLHLL